MHFNLFTGAKLFQIRDDCPIEVRATTGLARSKLMRVNGVFTALGPPSRFYPSEGLFIVPRFSKIELLAYSMPYDATGFGFKVKFDCRDTIPKLGVFYVYLNITSLEKLDVEPIQ